MKRTVCVLLVFSMMIFLCACGTGKKPDGMSDRDYQYGLSALESIDDFIGGKADAESTAANLERCDTLITDTLLSGQVGLCRFAVIGKGNGTKTIQAVKDSRNKLAKMLNEK